MAQLILEWFLFLNHVQLVIYEHRISRYAPSNGSMNNIYFPIESNQAAKFNNFIALDVRGRNIKSCYRGTRRVRESVEIL